MPAFVRCDSTNYSFPKGTLNKLKNKNLKIKMFSCNIIKWLAERLAQWLAFTC